MGSPHRLAGTLLAASLASTATPALTQIVNVHPLIAARDAEDGLRGAVEGSADVRSGNTRLLAVSSTAVVELRSGPHLAFLLLRGDFAERSGEPFVNKDLEHLRYRLSLKAPLDVEAFVQHDRDDFRRLSLRALAGAGPRVSARPFDAIDAAVGVALLLEVERLAAGAWPDAGERVFDQRLSTYLVLATSVAPSLRLSNTIYVQPRLDLFEDVRVLSETSCLVMATEQLSIKIALASAYDAKPPAGVIPLDATLKSAIQLDF